MVAVLCTHDRTMFCRRVGNSLHFSKVYVCGDVSPSVARVLVAVLLATSKLTDFPTLDGVSFGQPKSIPPSKGKSRLFQFRQKIDVQTVRRCLPPSRMSPCIFLSCRWRLFHLLLPIMSVSHSLQSTLRGCCWSCQLREDYWIHG